MIDEEEEERRAEKGSRHSVLFRLGSLLVMMVLVLGAIALVVYRDELNIDALRRTISYHSLLSGGGGDAAEFSFEPDSKNRYAPFDGGLLVASTSGCRLYARDGKEGVSETLYLEQPMISTGRSAAAVYDAGGSVLRLLDGRGILWSLDLPDGRAIYSARLNGSDWLAVNAAESGYKASVGIYNAKQKEVFRWNSSSRYVLDAAVSEDCKNMAAATVEQENAAFNTRIVFFRLDSEEEQARADLGDLVPLEMKYGRDNLWVVCDKKAVLLDGKGTVIGEYDYGGGKLADYSLDGDGFLTLLLGGGAGSGARSLVLIDSASAKAAELTVREEVYALSAAGRYVSLLFADRLDLYAGDLKSYASLDGTGSARSALQRADGSVLLVGEGSARLYLP